MNLATADLFHAEIARLQAEIDRLRSQPCPYVSGNVTRYCTLTPLTLTDAEREAVEAVLDDPDLVLGDAREPLRGLLDRLSPIKTAESDRPQAICTPESPCTPAECTVPPNCTKTGGK